MFGILVHAVWLRLKLVGYLRQTRAMISDNGRKESARIHAAFKWQ